MPAILTLCTDQKHLLILMSKRFLNGVAESSFHRVVFPARKVTHAQLSTSEGRQKMTTQTNEYENAEVITIGTVGDIVLGEKHLALIDEALAWPLIYRSDFFALYDDDLTD